MLNSPTGYVIHSLPDPQPIFDVIQRELRVSTEEMYHVYNMGIGFCLVVSHRSDHVGRTKEILKRHDVECAEIGRVTATKLNRASGPVTVLIPLRGVSAIDKFGGPFYSQDALNAYRRALKALLNPTIRLVELDAHINDEEFALAAADLLMEMLSASTETKAARMPR